MQDQQSERQQESRVVAHDVPVEVAPSQKSATISSSFPGYRRTHDYAYYKSVFGKRPMPFAFLDLDLLAQNILQVVALAQGKRVRLASKSLRSVAVIRRILEADPCFQGIMCYTAQEGAYLASQGFDDLLIGYPTWNEQDIAAVCRAIATGTHITCMIDSVEHVKRLETLAARFGIILPLCLEVDMSMDIPGLHFGVWRSPVRTPKQARSVLQQILASPHVRLDGLMGYEAQIAGVGDNVPGHKVKNTMLQMLKRRSIQEIAERRATLVELVRSYGISLRFVNGGGTGSLATTRAEKVVTEITIGSGFYAPSLFDHYRDFHYHPAAGFAIEIVRCPRPHMFTCLGGGYIASGSVGPEKQPQPYLPRGAKLVPLEGAGEVQTPIQYKGNVPLKIGDPVFMRHSKAGELCERFTHLLLVSDGTIVDEITTYRGDGQCFI